ncbi:uncharacterized protein METZ01_LOCUS242431 [marine metagenome]|uniref:Uncharacterized protein n=1 Tax=marine metagenome TaxID=408172 RepID=A0A382HRJ4_9ZZZZ
MQVELTCRSHRTPLGDGIALWAYVTLNRHRLSGAW